MIRQISEVRPFVAGVMAMAAMFFFPMASVAADPASAATLSVPGLDLRIHDAGTKPGEVATAIKIIILLTILSLAPAIMIAMTSFTRIIIVLAMLRHAFGMQETPPNTVLISLALFLTIFSMTPVFDRINESALAPYLAGKVNTERAFEDGAKPIKDFMVRQTRENDLLLILDLAKTKHPESPDDIRLTHLVPAFMLSELKTAFQIGFVIFVPFLLLDLVVASILMSMGMLMVPPMMISLPLKILMFVLIDGWNLVVGALMASFR